MKFESLTFEFHGIYSESQLFDVLFLAPFVVPFTQALPELVIAAAGFDGARHRDSLTEEEHFLFVCLFPGISSTIFRDTACWTSVERLEKVRRLKFLKFGLFLTRVRNIL